MLKRLIFLALLLLCHSLFLSQDVQRKNSLFLEDLIHKRSERLESMFSNVDVTIDHKMGRIIINRKQEIIRELVLEKVRPLTVEKIISFFLNVEESLLLIESFNSKTPGLAKRINVIDALYEYPFVDESGTFFVYISDKGTGNRNIFILDLVNGHEQEIIIPETGDYFPVLYQQMIFFLMAVENGFSLVSYQVKTGEMIELARGNLNSFKIYEGDIYYSNEKSIFKIDSQGKVLEQFEFQHPIQSFDINGTFLVLSMLNKDQYDLYLYNLTDKSIKQLTESLFNELDIVFKNQHTIIFSSNQTGHYGLYAKKISKEAINFNETLIYKENSTDLYYPFYSEYYSKIICSVYQTGKEPEFLVISF